MITLCFFWSSCYLFLLKVKNFILSYHLEIKANTFLDVLYKNLSRKYTMIDNKLRLAEHQQKD